MLLEEASRCDAGAMISNLTDPKLQTPLHIACNNGSDQLVVLLLNHGASINPVDSTGMNCMHLACMNGHKGCLALLLDHLGGDDLIEEIDSQGKSLFMNY